MMPAKLVTSSASYESNLTERMANSTNVNLTFSGNSTSQNVIYTTTDILLMVSLSATIIVSLICNGTVAWILSRSKKTSTTTTISKFLKSLVYSNFAITCVLPFHLFAIISFNTFVKKFPADSLQSAFLFMVFEVINKASWLTLAEISIERYCIFVQCTQERPHQNRFYQNCFICVPWILSFLPTLSMTFSVAITYQRHGRIFSVERKGNKNHTIFDTMYFFLPLLVMLFCWGRIFMLAASKRLRVCLGTIEPENVLTATVQAPPTTVTASGGLARFTIGSVSIVSGTSGGHRPSIPTTFVYNKSLKALRTVVVIVGSYILTTGLYNVSLLFDCFDVAGTYRDHWMHPLGYSLLCWSCAVYPIVYGCVVKAIREEIVNLFCRSSNATAGLPPRRWSVSSFLFDYAPRPSTSRRPSQDDALTTRRRSSSSSDTYSDSSSIFSNFFSSRAARRRVSAPSRMQNSVGEGHVLAVTA